MLLIIMKNILGVSLELGSITGLIICLVHVLHLLIFLLNSSKGAGIN